MKTHAGAPPALGIDLGGSKIEARLFDASRRELWRERVATPRGGYPATLDAIGRLVQRARQQLGGLQPTLGIGTPGNAGAGGRIKNANSTSLNGRPLQADLEARLGQPLALANDANCLALSEAVDGAGAGAHSVFAVILGTGVGAGIAIGGTVLDGPNGLAGEWGHNPLPAPTDDERPGPHCYCGRRGCVEAWLSGPALAADHARCGGASLDAATIGAQAAAGDPACAATLERHADRLARALGAVINLLDPEVIVLAGGVSLLPGLLPALEARLGAHVFGLADDPPLRTRLALAVHGDASGVRGAAWLGRALAGR
ncbi:MAG TPA: ROK family protein [Methylibium sp.]|nr:ROK family protein [Methylibium sp.]